MPKKITEIGNTMSKWNFYVSKKEKAEFIRALVINGHEKSQSAALRALMELYSSGQIDANIINPLIEKHKLYKQNGEISKN